MTLVASILSEFMGLVWISEYSVEVNKDKV